MQVILQVDAASSIRDIAAMRGLWQVRAANSSSGLLALFRLIHIRLHGHTANAWECSGALRLHPGHSRTLDNPKSIKNLNLGTWRVCAFQRIYALCFATSGGTHLLVLNDAPFETHLVKELQLLAPGLG